MANVYLVGTACVLFILAVIIMGITYSVHKSKLESGFKGGFITAMVFCTIAMCIMCIGASMGIGCCTAATLCAMSPI